MCALKDDGKHVVDIEATWSWYLMHMVAIVVVVTVKRKMMSMMILHQRIRVVHR